VSSRWTSALVLAAACSSSRADEHAPAVAAADATTPVWEDLPFDVVGCRVQRLKNAAALELFHWRACEGLAGCGEAVWNDAIVGADGEIGRRTSVDDDGTSVRVAVRWDSDDAAQAGVVVTREDGSILLGLRTSTAGPCNMNIPSVAHGRFGVLVTRSASATEPVREGGLLASVSDLDTLAPFEIDPLPAGSGPDESAMGSSRWLWRFAPDRLATFSAIDGTDAEVFAEVDDATLSLGGPTSTGPSFLFDMVERAPDGEVRGFIAHSDGIGAPERLVEAPPGTWDGVPFFAHSHVAWQRGIGRSGPNRFATVEVWAAEHGESTLAPYLVGEAPLSGWSRIGAGWGRYVTLGPPHDTSPPEWIVWDLERRTHTSIVPPIDRAFETCAGVTRSAVFAIPTQRTSSRRGLLRLDI
jgi:hypothetical protein